MTVNELYRINWDNVALIMPQSDVFMQCDLLKDRLVDVYYSVPILVNLPDKHRDKVIINYCYSHILKGLYVLIGTEKESIMVGKIIFPKEITKIVDFLPVLYRLYNKCFLNEKDENNYNFDELKLAHSVIYRIFIQPIFSLIPSKNVHLLIAQHIFSDDKGYHFDLAYIADLAYRFNLLHENNHVVMTTIIHNNIKKYLSDISHIELPTFSSISVLFGLSKQDRKEILEKCLSEKERNSCKLREHVYNTTKEIMISNGGEWADLERIEQFELLFQNTNSAKTIQIISHFHYDRFFTKTMNTISFKNINKIVDKLNFENKLRKNIVIDAITCSNYESLKRLYDMGVCCVYGSHHNLDNDLVAYMLYELYTGDNAKNLGWDYPYLNGKSYIHEIWSNITRCFYTTMNLNNHIQIP